jgi:hypothetical protein
MRAGTAIQVAGKGTYWIAGTDGKLRARSHAQYLAAGYDPSQLIEVGGLTDLSFAKGAPSSAVALRADGALFVTPSRVDYVMAGNKAFAFTTHAELLATMALDHARMLSRSITASWRMAVPVNGTLFRVHNRGVFVSYGGVLYGPVSAARLSADGYLSARAVPVPSTAGLRTRATA